MSNIVDLKSGKSIEISRVMSGEDMVGNAQAISSPMRFWGSNTDPKLNSNREADSILPVDDGADMHDERTVIPDGDTIPNQKNRWGNLITRAHRWYRVWLLDTALYQVLSLTYYPVRDYIRRRVGTRQFQDLIALSLKHNRPGFRVDIGLYNGERIVIRAEIREQGDEQAKTYYNKPYNIVSGLLPGHCRFFSLRLSEMRAAHKRIVHLSKIAALGPSHKSPEDH